MTRQEAKDAILEAAGFFKLIAKRTKNKWDDAVVALLETVATQDALIDLFLKYTGQGDTPVVAFGKIFNDPSVLTAMKGVK